MFNEKERRNFCSPTVGAFIEELKKLPQDAKIYICGSDAVYIHVSEDEKVVCFDEDALEDNYSDAGSC